jgi:16S rRNA (guanine527-N7)-methyltransferase
LDILAEGAAALGLPLRPEQLAAFARYRDELLAWNRRVNLTSINEPAEVETRHFLDSLTCAAALLARWGAALPMLPLRCIDVGSGGGFPGVPLKLALPRLRVTLLEATGKKAEFLDHLIAALALSGVDAVAERAETLGHAPEHRESYDAVFARALAPLPALLELTLPFLRVGGLLVAQRRGDLADEIAAAAFACETLGGAPPTVVPVTVPPLDDGRALVVVEKAAATPSAYPRRPGVPAKRSLARQSGQ